MTKEYWEELKRKARLDIDYRSVTHMGLYVRLWYYILLGVGVVYYLHGVGGFARLAVIVSVNYMIGRIFGPSPLNPILTWVWNCGILFSSDYFEGYRFAPILGDNYLWLVSCPSHLLPYLTPDLATPNQKYFNLTTSLTFVHVG